MLVRWRKWRVLTRGLPELRPELQDWEQPERLPRDLPLLLRVLRSQERPQPERRPKDLPALLRVRQREPLTRDRRVWLVLERELQMQE